MKNKLFAWLFIITLITLTVLGVSANAQDTNFAVKKRTATGKHYVYRAMWGVYSSCATYANNRPTKPAYYKRLKAYRRRRG